MRDIVYLVADRAGVHRMTKGVPSLKRGEIPVRLSIEIDSDAFDPPVPEQHIHITDWRPGRAVTVNLKELTITQDDAAALRRQILLEMRRELEGEGFTILVPGELGTASDLGSGNGGAVGHGGPNEVSGGTPR
jgi:hypothetical protein